MWKKLKIEDKELFDSYFLKNSPEMSDYTFTNLFLWHFSDIITYEIINNYLCIQVESPHKKPFVFMPIGKGDIKDVITELLRNYQDKNLNLVFKAVDKNMIRQIKEIFPNLFFYEEDRDRFDYIYSVQELIELKGIKYRSKRNYITRFMNNYDYKYYSLNDNLIEEVIQACIEWYNNRNISIENLIPIDELEYEKIGILGLLNNYEKLKYKGGLIKVDNKIVAFTFGEKLNSNTVVIHIEKANIEYIGAYQIINQLFLLNEWKNMKYVNREEDLGIEGLRKAKMSYKPSYMVDKYKVILKNIL